MNLLRHVRVPGYYFEAVTHSLPKIVYLLDHLSNVQLIRNGVIKHLLSLCLCVNKPLLHIIMYGKELLKRIKLAWKQPWADTPGYLKSLENNLSRT